MGGDFAFRQVGEPGPRLERERKVKGPRSKFQLSCPKGSRSHGSQLFGNQKLGMETRNPARKPKRAVLHASEAAPQDVSRNADLFV